MSKRVILGIIFLFIGIGVFLSHVVPTSFINMVFAINLLLSLTVYLFAFGRRWHPVLVFLGTLTLFQGGKILYSLFDESVDIAYVSLMGADYYLSDNTLVLAVTMICLSYWFVLLGALLSGGRRKKTIFVTEDEILKNFFLIVFLITLPFLIYKTLNYYKHFLQSGYLGFYQDTAHLEDVGLVVRSVSFIPQVSFLGYFFLERNRKRILLASLLLLVATLPTLLSGFRGPFLTFWLTLFLFYKIRFNDKISFAGIIFIMFSISLISLTVFSFRNSLVLDVDYTLELFKENPILSFFEQQGVSFYVTTLTIDNEKSLAPFNYLAWGIMSALAPSLLNIEGRSLATDLMIAINYEAFKLGLGTGSAYIAEAYLLGHILGVCSVSFFIGFLLNRLLQYYISSGVFVKIVVFTFIQYTTYLPRDLLLMPVSQSIKTGIYSLGLYLMFKLIEPLFSTFKKGHYGKRHITNIRQ